MSPQEARARLPQFVINDDETCILDPWAGYLESGLAVSYPAQMARRNGVRIMEHTPVTRVEDGSAGAKVVVHSGPMMFDRVVVAAGVWLGHLIPDIGRHTEVTRQQYVLIEVEDTKLFVGSAIPVWSFNTVGELWYGFPLLRGGYVKVSNDRAGEVVAPDDDRELTPEFVGWAMECLRERTPETAKGNVVGGSKCFFNNTPDDHFIIDWAPGSKQILIAGGGSSHGFKFGGSIGEGGGVIADALEEKPNRLGDLFRLGDRLSQGRRPRHKSEIPGYALSAKSGYREAGSRSSPGGGLPHRLSRTPRRMRNTRPSCPFPPGRSLE